ncbi:hypothetical protein [Spirosoma sordidisoli]|uniref:Uncharacterized protein n=1 Tax=Spirosoma sordidisoli TaxID=2502893 RepID=A0A4Q2UMU4_9BACT|nr:hypothetical protein [Spirosoma sordidisoli]RYC70724.1 hypothetical protein EQG79_00800 [Spirosoma sordidisoli]
MSKTHPTTNHHIGDTTIINQSGHNNKNDAGIHSERDCSHCERLQLMHRLLQDALCREQQLIKELLTLGIRAIDPHKEPD